MTENPRFYSQNEQLSSFARRSGQVSCNLPGGSNDGESEGECEADEGPGVGLNAVEHVHPSVRIAILANSVRW